MSQDQDQMSEGQIRLKRLNSEIEMLRHLNKDLFKIKCSENMATGYHIKVTI